MSARRTRGVEFADFILRRGAAPMEARSAESLPNEPGKWQFEPKWDGFRCLAFKDGGAVELKGKIRDVARAAFSRKLWRRCWTSHSSDLSSTANWSSS